MLNYETLYEVARLEQQLREREFARAARYLERPVERHAALSGRRSKRGRLVAVAGLVGAVALLLASAELPATIHAQESTPPAVLIVDVCDSYITC
jgi:hypothetical protein